MREHPAWKNDRTARPRASASRSAAGRSACRRRRRSAGSTTDGTIRVHVGSVDISGVNSSFVLVAAEILGVSPDQVEIIQGDTADRALRRAERRQPDHLQRLGRGGERGARGAPQAAESGRRSFRGLGRRPGDQGWPGAGQGRAGARGRDRRAGRYRAGQARRARADHRRGHARRSRRTRPALSFTWRRSRSILTPARSRRCTMSPSRMSASRSTR